VYLKWIVPYRRASFIVAGAADDNAEIAVMKAMILAAGEGTRLRPLTLALPKPMVPLANTPLLVRTIRLLAAQGVKEIAINLYHRPDAIRQALGDGSAFGVRLHYSDEPTLLGTAGGVKKMARFLDETFLVLYGDNLYHADFSPLKAFHRERNAVATLATFEAANPSACGLIAIDAAGRVVRFQEKPPPEQVFTNQANAGVYVLEPEILERIPDGVPYDFGRDVFPTLLAARPGAIVARSLGGYLQDTGTVSAYRQANWDLLEGAAGAPESGLSAEAAISADAGLTGRNVVGAGCVVKSGARLHESILWDGVIVSEGASVRGAILGRGVHVGAGAIIGEGAILADEARIEAGAVVPEGARIAPGERITAA
jgi:NDP-sugar pyrophosphorylase family protein